MTALPQIRGYRVLGSIGRGGMGEVFLAEDETLERRVAIKTIAPGLAGEGAARARFLREARAMAGVEHPHVVRVYAFGEAEGRPYIVMEYVDGETLAARLARATRLAVEDALRIAGEVAQALAAAWGRGIVHRDVKPANILLDREDRARVADFGLARPRDRGDAAETGAGTVLGTPHYMSPEQARGEEIDFRSDVYSLGIVLYEMLGGRKPFSGKSPVEVMARALTEPLPPIREARPEVPLPLAALVEEMTAKSPAARPASYADLLRRLGAPEPTGPALDSATSTMPRLPRVRAPRAAARRPPARRGWIAAVAVALLAAAAILLGLGRWRGGRHHAFAVAVAPFYGVDPESEKEARVLASLLESELARRFPEAMDVVGAQEVRAIVRTPRAARALAEKLGVDVVVWGEALAFRGEVELATHLTRKDGTLLEASAQDETLPADAPNALALRRARAAAVADKVAELYRRR